MDFWTALLALILTPAAVAGVVGYMLKEFLAQMRARDLEQYKDGLQRERERDKKLLEATQFEQQTRFSWAHQKQADVIATVYGKLADTRQKMAAMTSPAQFGSVDKEQQRKAAADAYDALAEYFIVNRVFLSEKRSVQIEELITMMRTSFNQFAMVQAQIASGRGGDDGWTEAWKRVEEEVPPVLTALRREFRASLGIAE
jgi:hypothetical protein